MTLTRIKMFRKGKRTFLNIFHPLLNPATVFALSRRKEPPDRTAHSVIKIMALLLKAIPVIPGSE